MRAYAECIAILGVFLGALYGGVIANIAWEHNPQNAFRENPHEIAFIFYFSMSLVALPFFVIRQLMLYKDRQLWIGAFIAALSTIVLVSIGLVKTNELNYEMRVLSLFAGIYALNHIVNWVRCYLNNRKLITT